MLILASRAIWRYRLEDITPAFAAKEILETMSEALIVLDRDGVVRVVNSAACSLLACREEDLVGKRAGDGPDPFRPLTEKLRTISTGGAVRNVEVVCRPPDGAQCTLSLSASVMKNAAGEQVATVCVVNDISERKRAEQSLLLFRNLLDRSSDAIFVNDPATGRFLMVNEQACSTLGYAREELLSMSTIEVESRFRDRALWDAHVREVQARGSLIVEGSHRRSNGTLLPVEVSVVYLTLAGRDYMVAVVRDISERKSAEAAREQLIGRLQEANEKLQSIDRVKSNFISMVSHELRTPLTTIKAFVELMLVKKEMSDVQKRKLMATVNVEADRLARLISDLLDLARIEAGALQLQKEQVLLEELVHDVVEGMAVLFEKRGLRVTTECEAGMPGVAGDRDRLVQVVTNILSNAVKFTQPGGTIRVALRKEHAPQPRVVAEISDTGIGIEEDNLERIFEKFHRADDKQTAGVEGTGLGLAISREIVERHGGTIWATSTYGKGSTFSFTLPLAEDASSDSSGSLKCAKSC